VVGVRHDGALTPTAGRLAPFASAPPRGAGRCPAGEPTWQHRFAGGAGVRGARRHRLGAACGLVLTSHPRSHSSVLALFGA